LRLERVQGAIDKELALHPPSPSSEAFAAIADGISDNAQLIWRDVEPRMPTLVKALQLQRMHPERSLSASDLSDMVRNANQTPSGEEIPPGCRIDSQHWTDTFLCNPQLQNAIVAFQSSNEKDTGFLEQYQNAIPRDWRLLSGVQVRWAESVLKTNRYHDSQIPLSVIALGGDIQSMPVLAEIDTSSWTPEDRRFRDRVQQFLAVHGRDTSLKAIQTAGASSIAIGDLLSYPKGMQFTDGVEKLVPPETTTAIRTFLRINSGASIGGALSPLVLAMIVERKTVGDAYSLLADILLKSGDTDSALRYAQEGLTKGGSARSLENDIGNILSAKGDLRNANEHYLKSLDAGRSDGWPEINMAQNLADLGEIDSAESWFMRGLKRTPRGGSEYTEYINDYAWFLAIHRASDNKKVQEALALSELSNVLTQRSNPNFLDTLAECQAVNGKFSEAVSTEREALKLVIDDATHQKYASRVEYFEKKLQAAGELSQKPSNP
jgi:tetratricopeptide (TPR) repeat protein